MRACARRRSRQHLIRGIADSSGDYFRAVAPQVLADQFLVEGRVGGWGEVGWGGGGGGDSKPPLPHGRDH